MNIYQKNIVRKLAGNAIEQETENWENPKFAIPPGKRAFDTFGDLCVYDSNGNKIYSKSKDGVVWLYTYDSNGNEIYQENSEGFWEERKYDSKGRILTIKDSHGWFDDFSSDYSKPTSVKNVKSLTPEEVLLIVQDNYGISEAVQEYLGWSEEEAENADGTNWDDVVEVIMSKPKLLKQLYEIAN